MRKCADCRMPLIQGERVSCEACSIDADIFLTRRQKEMLHTHRRMCRQEEALENYISDFNTCAVIRIKDGARFSDEEFAKMSIRG